MRQRIVIQLAETAQHLPFTRALSSDPGQPRVSDAQLARMWIRRQILRAELRGETSISVSVQLLRALAA